MTNGEIVPSPSVVEVEAEDRSTLIARFAGLYAFIQETRVEFDEVERELLLAVHDEGASWREMAEAVGVSHSTLQRHAYESAREKDRVQSRLTYQRMRSRERDNDPC